MEGGVYRVPVPNPSSIGLYNNEKSLCKVKMHTWCFIIQEGYRDVERLICTVPCIETQPVVESIMTRLGIVVCLSACWKMYRCGYISSRCRLNQQLAGDWDAIRWKLNPFPTGRESSTLSPIPFNLTNSATTPREHSDSWYHNGSGYQHLNHHWSSLYSSKLRSRIRDSPVSTPYIWAFHR